MTALNEIKKTYAYSASAVLGDYLLLSRTELANGYCDADESGNYQLRDAYFAALVLRYWYKIYEWKSNSASLGLPIETFVEWLEDSLLIALKYRAWRIPGNSLYNDPNGPDKAINRSCFSTRGREYQCANKDKRKSNTQTISMESIVDDNGKPVEYLGSKPAREVDGAKELVEIFLGNNKLLEALIVDGVAYQDSFKTTKVSIKQEGINSQGQTVMKRYSKETDMFDMRKLVKHLSTIDTNFIRDYFCSTYFISPEKGEEILSRVSEMSNPKWYKCIQKTFLEIKGDKKLLSCLMDV